MKWLNTKTDTPPKGRYAAVMDGKNGFLVVDSYSANFYLPGVREPIVIELENLPVMCVQWLEMDQLTGQTGGKYKWGTVDNKTFSVFHSEGASNTKLSVTHIATTDNAEKADFISKACNQFKI